MREEAEARFARDRKARAPSLPTSALVHELQVHQIELEMQNEELRRDQLELELAHERYVDLYEFAPVGYLTLSGVGAIREANLNGAGMLGVERAVLLGRNFAAFVSPDHSDRWHRHREEIARSGGRGSLDLVFQRGDGSSFQAHVSCSRHEDPEDPAALRVAFTEVVAQKRADAHALDTERMGALQGAMSLLPIGVTLVELDRDGTPRFTSHNSAFDILDPSVGAVSRTSAQMPFQIFRPDRKSLVPPDEWPGPRAARTGIAAREAELHIRQASGVWRIVSVSASPIRGRSPGEPRRAVAVLLDITDLSRRNEELRESEERFRAVVERSSDLTLILNDEGTITFASPASIDILGVAPSELKGRPGLEWIHPDDADAFRASFATLVGNPTLTQGFELRMRRGDGTWALLEAEARSMVDVPGVHGVVINHRDVSESNHFREQFRESQKADTIGRLASGIAHDFNNLLTVILSCGEDLRRTLREGSPSDPGCADDIVAASRRAADLTRQLLVFARKEVITPVSLDLNDLVRNGGKLLRRVIGERIRIVEEFTADLWPARCDPGLVGQVIMNLALNARDAMPDGGTLTLGTDNVTVAPGEVAPDPEMEPGSYVKLVVGDTGTGMTPGVMKHIFEPLFTTKEQGQGTGLGLSMVRGIVMQSKAHLCVRSVVGSGTAFEIFFPKDEEKDGVPAGATAAPEGGTETVLVVEDDPKVREVAVRALRSGGYRVLAAAGCDEAIHLVRAETGPLDLLVTDLVLPGPGGREVAARVAELRPGVRTVFISGYTDASIFQGGVRLEEFDFLPKPFTSSSLLREARRVLDRGRGVDV